MSGELRILEGATFCICDFLGDLHGNVEGLFAEDTRFLSSLKLTINGQRPLLLSSNGSRPSARPAALTRMSMPLSSSVAAVTKRSQSAGSVTSSSSGVTGGAIRSIRRAPPTTRAPSAASACAVAAPMPLDAPVTTADFPSRLGTGGDYRRSTGVRRATASPRAT